MKIILQVLVALLVECSHILKMASEVSKRRMYVPIDERGDHHEGYDNRHKFGKKTVLGSRRGGAL